MKQKCCPSPWSQDRSPPLRKRAPSLPGNLAGAVFLPLESEVKIGPNGRWPVLYETETKTIFSLCGYLKGKQGSYYLSVLSLLPYLYVAGENSRSPGGFTMTSFMVSSSCHTVILPKTSFLMPETFCVFHFPLVRLKVALAVPSHMYVCTS